MSSNIDVTGELDFSEKPVSPEGRMSRLALTMAFWAVCSAMFWMIVSAVLSQAYGTANTIIGLILSAIVYSLINGPIVRYAIKSGLSVSLFSRLLFGLAVDCVVNLDRADSFQPVIENIGKKGQRILLSPRASGGLSSCQPQEDRE